MISKPWSWWCDSGNRNDEYTKVVFTLLIALIGISCYNWMIKKKFTKENALLPPGPWGLPLVGNLPFLNRNMHCCFARLASIYGPIMRVQIGSRLCIILSSPSVAKEVLKDHDITFANHDVRALVYIASYGGLSMAWAPYGEHWRMVRKVCVSEILSNTRLESLYGLRRREVLGMVNNIYSKIGHPIDVGEHILIAMFNIITSMLWGGQLEGDERSRVTAEFHDVMEKLMGLFGEQNISDLFPAITQFDIQGKQRRMKKLVLWFDRMFDSVIDQRLEMEARGESNSSGGEKKDFLQVLLQLMDQEGDQKTPFTRTHIKALLMDMMVAGTRTSSRTVEWAMAELMKHPEIMRKAQEELEEIVGMNNIVEETHLPKLHYIDAIVKEALRLHPVTPFLIPRYPTKSCIVSGYMVPKGAKVIVNAWAIHRDPRYWKNPLDFKPERFLNSEWNYNPQDHRYMPFGSGRRICVGLPLAERALPCLLASLVHSFEWKLPEGIEVDLSEAFGLELKKKTPLIAIPTPRLFDPELYK